MKRKTALLALVLILCLTNLVTAAVWLLTIRVPIDYAEPLEFYATDESVGFEYWEKFEVPGTYETESINITEFVYEDRYMVNNTVGKALGVRVTVQAFFSNGTATNLIGFNASQLDGAEIITEGITLPYLSYGGLTIEFVIPAKTTATATMFYVLHGDIPPPQGDTGFYALWTVERFEPPP